MHRSESGRLGVNNGSNEEATLRQSDDNVPQRIAYDLSELPAFRRRTWRPSDSPT